MSLTRSLLKELQISPDAAERIIAAHAESIDALRQERDAARGEAAQLESIRAALAEMTQARDEACQARDSAREELSALGGQFDSYRQQVETEKHQQARHANLRAALQSAGANPHALDLLLLALHPDESAFDGDEITDPGRAAYSPQGAVRRVLRAADAPADRRRFPACDRRAAADKGGCAPHVAGGHQPKLEQCLLRTIERRLIPYGYFQLHPQGLVCAPSGELP